MLELIFFVIDPKKKKSIFDSIFYWMLYRFQSKRTKARGELLKGQITIAICVQSVKDVLKFLSTQRKLSI